MLIIGSDCILRIESIIYLINDEIFKRKFIKKMRQHRKTLDELTKKDIKEQENIKKKNHKENLTKMCKEYLKKIEKQNKTLCENFDYNSDKLNQCQSIKDLKKIVFNPITIYKNDKYPFNFCNLCWTKYKDDKIIN